MDQIHREDKVVPDPDNIVVPDLDSIEIPDLDNNVVPDPNKIVLPKYCEQENLDGQIKSQGFVKFLMLYQSSYKNYRPSLISSAIKRSCSCIEIKTKTIFPGSVG